MLTKKKSLVRAIYFLNNLTKANTFEALGGKDQRSGFINKKKLQKLLIDDFQLDIDMEVPSTPSSTNPFLAVPQGNRY